MKVSKKIRQRLEYLRRELRIGRLSWGEIVELQSLAKYIEAGDMELLEAAGVPEFPETDNPLLTALEDLLDLTEAYDVGQNSAVVDRARKAVAGDKLYAGLNAADDLSVMVSIMKYYLDIYDNVKKPLTTRNLGPVTAQIRAAVAKAEKK
jgi:hypothetical protein